MVLLTSVVGVFFIKLGSAYVTSII